MVAACVMLLAPSDALAALGGGRSATGFDRPGTLSVEAVSPGGEANAIEGLDGKRGPNPGLSSGPTCEAAPGHLLVTWRASPSRSVRSSLTAELRGGPLQRFRLTSRLELWQTSRPLAEAAALLRARPDVERVELDCLVHIDATPNDPGYAQQWGLNNTGQTGGTPGADIRAAGGWALRTDASGVTVAIVDTGMQLNHPDLSANLWTNPGEIGGNGLDDDGNGYVDDVHGWDFVNDDPNPTDDNGHGTHVSGIVGARGNNGVGVTGVAWSVKLMPLKAFDAGGSGATSAIIAALEYASIEGARVSNNSYSTTDFARSMYDAFASTGAAGMLSVAAAGNDGESSDESPHYPAAFRLATMISVASITADDLLAGSSNYGIHNVQVAAPGNAVYSTLPGSTYGTYSGTSMATPHVVGVAALLVATHPTWTPSAVRDRILGTTRAVAALVGKTWTGGVVDLAAALGSGPTVLPPPFPAFTPAPLVPTLVSDPNPSPVAASAPPTFPTPEVLETSPLDPGPPSITLDGGGHPFIAYTQTGNGVHLWSNTTGSWVDRRVTNSYADFYWLDLAMNGGSTPTLSLQRRWGRLDEYSDPGIVQVTASSPTSTESRITASCPDVGSCFEDWNPSLAYDAAGKAHVVFSRQEALDAASFSDHVFAPDGPASADGPGLYYATDATGSWVVQHLTTGATDGPTYVAVEADGTVHAVFYRRDGTATGVYYVTDQGGSWTIRRLTDFVEDRGLAIAVDGAGVVHVVVARQGLGVYYLRRATNGTWASATRVYDGSAIDPSVAIEGNDKVHMAFGLADDSNTVAGVRYATNRTGSWAGSMVASGQSHSPDIAVDSAGHASIAYLQAAGTPLGVYYASNASGSFQSTLVRAASSEGGAGAAAYVVDGSGVGHAALASHFGEASAGLWYGTNQTGSWVFSRVYAGWPTALSLAVDQNGKAHIAFAEELNALSNTFLPASRRMIGWSTNVTGTWVTSRVSPASDFSSSGVGIAVDATGSPHIVYVLADTLHLVRARRSGTSWAIDDVYDALDQLREPSVVMDSGGQAHITFTALFDVDLGARVEYVHGTAGNWLNTSVTYGYAWDSRPSIARATDGTIWIAASRDQEGVWAFRRNPDESWTTFQVGSDPADILPSISVDVANVPRIAYVRGVLYGTAGCTVPMCDEGAGVRHAWYSSGTWHTERLTPYWQDDTPFIAAGQDGSLSVAFVRTTGGMRRVKLVPGKPAVSLDLSAASDSGASSSDNITNAGALSFAVTFNRAVTGVALGDFTRAGTATGCLITSLTGSATTYALAVTGCSQGTVTLSFAANGATDAGSVAGPVVKRSGPTVTIDRTAPVAVAPKVTMRSGISLASASKTTGALAAVGWSATDTGGSGAATYDVARSYDGAAFAALLTGTAGKSSNVSLTPGHTFRYKIRARDLAGNLGGFVAGATVKPSLLQQTSNSVHYTKKWSTGTYSSYSRGTVRFSKAAGASASYTFTGRGIALVTSKRAIAGKVKIYIDGVLISTIDTHAATTTYRVIAYARTWTTSGTHTIRLVVSGTSGRPRVDLDAFEVLR